jgi:thioredoxin-related protein
MNPKKLIFILSIVALILFSGCTGKDTTPQTEKDTTPQTGKTTEEMEEIFQTAQQENKPIMIYFWANWSKYCAGFKTKTLENPQVKKILEEDYVLVEINLDIDKEVAQQYGVRNVPYLVLMDPKGNILEKVVGDVEPSYLLPIVMQIREKVRGK